MQLYLNNQHTTLKISRIYLEKRIRKILLFLRKRTAILGITFVTNRKISRLNKIFLGKKGPTDVLSFPMGEKGMLLGDVVVSLNDAKKQAKEFKRTLRDQCLFLIIHGILHLLGYDHVRWKDYIKMKRKEERLWKLNFVTIKRKRR